MNMLDVLRWAAGADVDLPNIDGQRDERVLYLLGVDEDELLALLKQHRLIHRFLYRYKEERPGWCTRALLAEVRREGDEISRGIRDQTDAIGELFATCPDPEHPDIILKGIGTYALTQDPRHIHWSNDVDVLPRDPERLQATLRMLGYTPTKPLDHQRSRASADAAGAAHSSRSIDTSPCSRTPPRCDLRSATRERVGGDVVETAHYARLTGQIQYDELESNCIVGGAQDMCALAVPNPTIAVLILCAHTFRNYVDRALFARSVRLSELADIADLTRDPRFDLSRFLALAERHGVQDAVALAGHLLKVSSAWIFSNHLAQSRVTVPPRASAVPIVVDGNLGDAQIRRRALEPGYALHCDHHRG